MIASTPEAIAIYEAYPRKVKKPLAIRAILKALTVHGFDRLLERTQEFAKRSSVRETQFIPYPATFFNQEMFNDNYDEIFPARNGHTPAVPEIPLWQRVKAIEALLVENQKQLQRTSLPSPLLYTNPNGERFQKDFAAAQQKREALKRERQELQAKLTDLQRQAAYAI